MKNAIEVEWQKIVKNFRESVTTAMENTEDLVNEGWKKAVQCEVENPCCEYNAVEWQNMQTKIQTLIKLHDEKTAQKETLAIRIAHMKEQCAPPEWNIDWAAYDQKATAMDAALAEGVEVEDTMLLDERLFDEQHQWKDYEDMTEAEKKALENGYWDPVV